MAEVREPMEGGERVGGEGTAEEREPRESAQRVAGEGKREMLPLIAAAATRVRR